MTQGKIVEGVFAIHKPTGITSAGALRSLQEHFNPSELFQPWIAAEKNARKKQNSNQRNRRREKQVQVKIGHGGTLDPLATGVLIAGIGKGTKVLQQFLECTKTYEAIVLFGASTDTYDVEGKILKKSPYDHITRETVEKALGAFRGKFMQTPPLYSALKMNGKPLYEYAREGKEIPREIEKRPVEVLELELLDWMEGDTHDYKWPEEEAGDAEKTVAEKLWKQEEKQDAKERSRSKSSVASKKRKLDDEAVVDGVRSPKRVAKSPEVEVKKESAEFAEAKQKLDAEQDALVKEESGLKKATPENAADDTVMSGGLAATSKEGAGEAQPSPALKGPPAAKLRMTVTSGFYVRSLCHDLGHALGSQAIMASLVRSRQGQFELGKNVLEWEDLSKGEAVWGPKVEQMLDAWAGDYKPFAGSNAESNVPVKAEDTASKKEETIEQGKKEESAKTSAPVKQEDIALKEETAAPAKQDEVAPKKEEASV